ncbi:MAG: choice-of-anchor Q domain-containing protein [Nitrospirota bacterium]
MKGFKVVRWFSCIIAALIILFTGIVSAYAAAINVTANATDTLNGADGQCSLREAIQNINNGATTYADCVPTGAYGTSDTINIPAGTYTIAIAGAGEDLNATGDFDITKSVTITGAGAGSTTINGGALDRVFHITGAYTVSISGVTIQNGSPASNGGGIHNNSGTLTVTNSTIVRNTATTGGGIYKLAGATGFTNSIVADNGVGLDCVGTITDSGGNIDSDGNCGTFTQNAAMVQGTGFSALASNGGPTQTHALLAGSAAIDTAPTCAGLTTDQRGTTRPQGSACDIGAYEYVVAAAAVSVPTMTEWGMIIFIFLAGLGAMYYMRRRRA